MTGSLIDMQIDSRAIKLPFGYWMCKDSGAPVEYPPRAANEICNSRLYLDDCRRTIASRDEEVRMLNSEIARLKDILSMIRCF